MKGCDLVADIRLRNRIEKDLIAQLKEKEIKGGHYIDLVKDYLSMWDIKNAMIEDITDNGIQIPGMHGAKSNPSIADLHRTNDRMLKTLDALGLKAVGIEKPVKRDSEKNDLI